jgi:hypothetical protein
MIEKLVTQFITWLFTSSPKEKTSIQVPNPTAANYRHVLEWLRYQYDTHTIYCYREMAKERNAPPVIMALINEKFANPYKRLRPDER